MLAENIALEDAFPARFGDDVATGRITPVIDRTFPIERAEEAQAYMGANRSVGKIVLVVRKGEA